MFVPPLKNLKGTAARSAWDTHLQTALAALKNLSPANADQTLDTCLAAWEKGSAVLAADPAYQAAERYCIRQFYLWKIYSAFDALGLGKEAERKVYNRARDVLDETPGAARPTDQSFAEGEQLIKNTLNHLRDVALFYQNATNAADGLESFSAAAAAPLPDLPPSTGDFFCTVQLPPAMPADQARQFWQKFLADNTLVRLVTVGSGPAVRDVVDRADPIFFSPGGAQKPGRCLWVETPAIQPDVLQWLQQQAVGQPDTVRCIFLKASGKLSNVLRTADTIDETALLHEFLKATQTN